MSLLDGMLGSVGPQVAGAIASRMGISPAIAETAIAALTRAHPQPGDTVSQASATSGLSPDILSGVLGHLGGEGNLGQLSHAASSGSTPDLGGLLGGLLGR